MNLPTHLTPWEISQVEAAFVILSAHCPPVSYSVHYTAPYGFGVIVHIAGEVVSSDPGINSIARAFTDVVEKAAARFPAGVDPRQLRLAQLDAARAKLLAEIGEA